MLSVILVLATVLAFAGWCGWSWMDRRACERLPEQGEPRYAIYFLRLGPAEDGTDDGLDGAACYVGKSNDPAVRFGQHDDSERHTARDKRWKARVRTDRSTVVRWCRTEQDALDAEERLILAFATAVRLFGPLLRRQRWLPNVQQNRRPKDAEEWVKVAAWIVWLGLFPVAEYRVRRALRLPAGPGSKDAEGQPGIDGRWLWPWPRNVRERLIRTPPPPEARVKTRA